MFPGGIADKLGNEYERKWAVRKLLDVVAARATSVRYEGLADSFHGFEFALHQPDQVEWHQTKINSPHGNWTLNALKHEGVMDAFKRRLSADGAARCVFVSQDPASQMRKLSDEARMTNDLNEFLNAVSDKGKEEFDNLYKLWDVDERKVFEWLRRCEFRAESIQSIGEAITMYGRHLLRGDAEIFASLSDYLINKLNAPVTTEVARGWIRDNSPFTFRPAALDPTLCENVNTANQRYLDSYRPFGIAGQEISRAESSAILAELHAAAGPSLILLTGSVGSGKSGVVREVMAGLANSEVPHLAFRIDHYLSCRTGSAVGSDVLGRYESPVSALTNLAKDSPSILIVDQIDAVSEISGRAGAVKGILLELVRETRYYGNVRCLLVCRSFDLENDPHYREMEREHQAKRVQVPPLSWAHAVAPILDSAGVPTESLTESQRNLLSLPLNLSVFMDIGDPTFDFTTGTELMQRLLEKKIRELRKDRNIGWNVHAPLQNMAEWMSDKQELSCPDSLLDDFDGAKDWLSSEGLIVVEKHRLSFFHESLFDFIFARSFARSNRDIAGFLTSTEQHLFRRTQVRQILTSMRDTDRSRYLETLTTVLTHSKVRFHIKDAVVHWVAAIDSATRDELKVIQQLDDAGEEFPALMRRALFVSDSWFDVLNEGDELSSMLGTAEGARLRCLLRWLSDIADKRPGPVASLLKNWWERDSARAEQLIEWFDFVHPMPADQALITLLKDVIRSAPDNFFLEARWDRIVRLLPNVCEVAPAVASDILQGLFTQWFKCYPGKHPFTHSGARTINLDLVDLVEKHSAVFLDGMIPALLESLEIALNENASDHSFHILYQTSVKRGPDALFSLYRDAFRILAETSPPEAESRLDRLDPAGHLASLHLHLETIAANPAALGHRFDVLLDDERLFSAGLEGAEWESFARAARAVVTAERQPIEIIEERVFRYRPEHERAKGIWHEVRERGESEFVTKRCALAVLAKHGHVEWRVLKTIGPDLLSSYGKKRLEELERKFSFENVPTPNLQKATFLGSPIPSEATRKMTDEQWLSAINKYWTKNERSRFRDGEVVGGALQLARELEGRAKSDPDRFGSFFLRLPVTSNSIYGRMLLQGLAGAEHVDTGTTITAVQAAHAHPERPFGLQIIHIVEQHPECVRDDDVFEALLWYAEHGEASENLQFRNEGDSEAFTSIDELVRANDSLVDRGMNSARGAAWKALGRLLESHPHRAAVIWDLVERRASEETVAPVRAMMIYTLTSLFGLDLVRFNLCLRRLTESLGGRRDDVSALTPLTTYAGINLFRYIERDLPDLALKLMGRMIGSPDRTLHLIGTWWTLAERLRQGNSQGQFPDIERRSPAHTKLWASLLCDFAAYTKFRTTAISELERLFSHETSEVREEAAAVFWDIPGDDFPYFREMARSFVKAPAFQDSASPIIEALKKTSCDVTDLVLEVGKRIAGNKQDVRAHYAIEEILKREYVNSEAHSELRSRFLDLIDDMATKNLIGADDLMRLDDR